MTGQQLILRRLGDIPTIVTVKPPHAHWALRQVSEAPVITWPGAARG